MTLKRVAGALYALFSVMVTGGAMLAVLEHHGTLGGALIAGGLTGVGCLAIGLCFS